VVAPKPRLRPAPKAPLAPKEKRLTTTRSVVVLKLGGELLEQPADVQRIARGIRALARQASLTIVHGGGKEIDAALALAGIPKRQVDGLRVTDAPTLDAVVAVLAGAINTRLVAALREAGGSPVGLTGADAGVAVVKRAAPIMSTAGERVDLGLVGTPAAGGDPVLLVDLMARGYVPVVACVGATKKGQLLNVNADTLASHLAARLKAKRLVIAGGTAGVLDADGRTIARLTARDAAQLVKAGTANKGMVAKLQACRDALRQGVGDVLVANGRRLEFDTLANGKVMQPDCTQVVR
jgi:acetylglutamate kinase